MKKLFDEVSYDIARAVTHKYSTSFSYGIMSLSPKLRPGIYAIYGFVRLADEIVDSFHDFNKEALLKRFREDTWRALEERISLNPVLNSFQETVHTYKINTELIEQFLKSMEMDLQQLVYDKELYKEYILGSAEVVGLMCLQVFVEGDPKAYEKLEPYAMKLGSAFQKINFLRDMKDDYHVLGRTYFPGVDMLYFNRHMKSDIEHELEKEFEEALVGIRKLPISSRLGVYIAYRYYMSLFRKIKTASSQQLLTQRIRINNIKKLWLMLHCYFRFKFSML